MRETQEIPPIVQKDNNYPSTGYVAGATTRTSTGGSRPKASKLTSALAGVSLREDGDGTGTGNTIGNAVESSDGPTGIQTTSETEDPVACSETLETLLFTRVNISDIVEHCAHLSVLDASGADERGTPIPLALPLATLISLAHECPNLTHLGYVVLDFDSQANGVHIVKPTCVPAFLFLDNRLNWPCLRSLSMLVTTKQVAQLLTFIDTNTPVLIPQSVSSLQLSPKDARKRLESNDSDSSGVLIDSPVTTCRKPLIAVVPVTEGSITRAREDVENELEAPSGNDLDNYNDDNGNESSEDDDSKDEGDFFDSVQEEEPEEVSPKDLVLDRVVTLIAGFDYHAILQQINILVLTGKNLREMNRGVMKVIKNSRRKTVERPLSSSSDSEITSFNAVGDCSLPPTVSNTGVTAAVSSEFQKIVADKRKLYEVNVIYLDFALAGFEGAKMCYPIYNPNYLTARFVRL